MICEEYLNVTQIELQVDKCWFLFTKNMKLYENIFLLKAYT